MKLKDYKPHTAWNQLSDENKQKVLDIPISGLTYANQLNVSHGFMNMPLSLAYHISREFKTPINEFYNLFNVKL
jgi:hypothetical protein